MSTLKSGPVSEASAASHTKPWQEAISADRHFVGMQRSGGQWTLYFDTKDLFQQAGKGIIVVDGVAYHGLPPKLRLTHAPLGLQAPRRPDAAGPGTEQHTAGKSTPVPPLKGGLLDTEDDLYVPSFCNVM